MKGVETRSKLKFNFTRNSKTKKGKVKTNQELSRELKEKYKNKKIPKGAARITPMIFLADGLIKDTLRKAGM